MPTGCRWRTSRRSLAPDGRRRRRAGGGSATRAARCAASCATARAGGETRHGEHAPPPRLRDRAVQDVPHACTGARTRGFDATSAAADCLAPRYVGVDRRGAEARAPSQNTTPERVTTTPCVAPHTLNSGKLPPRRQTCFCRTILMLLRVCNRNRGSRAGQAACPNAHGCTRRGSRGSPAACECSTSGRRDARVHQGTRACCGLLRLGQSPHTYVPDEQ